MARVLAVGLATALAASGCTRSGAPGDPDAAGRGSPHAGASPHTPDSVPPHTPDSVPPHTPSSAPPHTPANASPEPATMRATPTAKPAAPPVDARRITARLDAFLKRRPGPVTAMVKDLDTGRTYRYHPRQRLITASTAKVQILMALLLKTPWAKLSDATRHDADIMIRHSDNEAADRLWTRIGGAPGFTKAGRRLGLKHTQGVAGDCLDLYCWGITRTSAEDQIRLMAALDSPRSPLAAADRDQVKRLMTKVIPEQRWGVSAAACAGEETALKNGWLKRVSTKKWAVVSVGLIAGRYAVAVLTEGSAEAHHGIATVEGVARRIMSGFRTC